MRQGSQGTKPLLNVDGDPSPNDLFAVEIKCYMENSCLSITRAAGLLSKVYNSLI